MKLKKGDRVRVLTGKDVGKEGEITRVLVERNRVIVPRLPMSLPASTTTSSPFFSFSFVFIAI